MHLATARNALYCYLLARQTGGQFILRIEDTDLQRTVPGSEQEIIDGLRWLGLDYDEGPDIGGPHGPYRQTERRELYLTQARILIERSHAYPCFCTPERLERVRQEQQQRKETPRYDGTCRGLQASAAAARVAAGEKHVVRFKMPQSGTTVAHDHLRGDILTENQHLNDYVLIKSDGLPTYHMAAMVDDHAMGITHVLRGPEWLPTFPLHVNILRAFGWDEPVWIHLSLFLKPSGKGKLSKRDASLAARDGYSVFIKDMHELGFIPEGVLNWTALMGWGVPEDDRMTLAEMLQRFSIDHLTASPAAINFAKLDHFNGAHIRLLNSADLAARLRPHFESAGLSVDEGLLLKITPLIRERLVTLDDCVAFAGFFFRDSVQPDPGELVPKGMSREQALALAREALEIMRGLPAVDAQLVEPPLRALLERSGRSANQLFGIMRVATTGQKVSPPLFETMELLGRDVVLARLEHAIDLLSSGAQLV
jgi:glutamyl-tRNA synthetase